MGGWIDKGRAARAAALLVMVAAMPAHGGTLDSPGCFAGGAPAVVVSVDPALDLHLGDGRVVRLPGIAVPDTPVDAQRDLSAWLTRAAVRVAPLRTEPDRWNRTVALVFASPPADPDRPVSVTEALVEAGAVLLRPEPALEPCWATMRRLEQDAEHARRGLWTRSPVLRPDDAAGLQAHAGAFAVVSGRVGAVREGRARTYLRFADDGGTGMAATLAPALVRRLAHVGTAPRDWTGRPLRVRGLLDDRWGWQIEVTTPQQIEFDFP